MTDATNAVNSFDTMIKKAIKNSSFDKTIVCQIIKTYEKEPGVYMVTTGLMDFKAYSQDLELAAGDTVQVLIPNGDYDEQKIILGKTDKIDGPIDYKNPKDNIAILSKNLLDKNISPSKLIITENSYELLKLVNNTYQSNKINITFTEKDLLNYNLAKRDFINQRITRLYWKFNIKTSSNLFTVGDESAKIIKADMGIQIKLNGCDNFLFQLPFSEMNGNLYNTSPFSLSQEVCWEIDLGKLFPDDIIGNNFLNNYILRQLEIDAYINSLTFNNTNATEYIFNKNNQNQYYTSGGRDLSEFTIELSDMELYVGLDPEIILEDELEIYFVDNDGVEKTFTEFSGAERLKPDENGNIQYEWVQAELLYKDKNQIYRIKSIEDGHLLINKNIQIFWYLYDPGAIHNNFASDEDNWGYLNEESEKLLDEAKTNYDNWMDKYNTIISGLSGADDEILNTEVTNPMDGKTIITIGDLKKSIESYLDNAKEEFKKSFSFKEKFLLNDRIIKIGVNKIRAMACIEGINLDHYSNVLSIKNTNNNGIDQNDKEPNLTLKESSDRNGYYFIYGQNNSIISDYKNDTQYLLPYYKGIPLLEYLEQNLKIGETVELLWKIENLEYFYKKWQKDNRGNIVIDNTYKGISNCCLNTKINNLRVKITKQKDYSQRMEDYPGASILEINIYKKEIGANNSLVDKDESINIGHIINSIEKDENDNVVISNDQLKTDEELMQLISLSYYANSIMQFNKKPIVTLTLSGDNRWETNASYQFTFGRYGTNGTAFNFFIAPEDNKQPVIYLQNMSGWVNVPANTEPLKVKAEFYNKNGTNITDKLTKISWSFSHPVNENDLIFKIGATKESLNTTNDIFIENSPEIFITGDVTKQISYNYAILKAEALYGQMKLQSYLPIAIALNNDIVKSKVFTGTTEVFYDSASNLNFNDNDIIPYGFGDENITAELQIPNWKYAYDKYKYQKYIVRELEEGEVYEYDNDEPKIITGIVGKTDAFTPIKIIRKYDNETNTVVGTYTLTTDITIQSGKTYYKKVGAQYNEVAQPKIEEIGSYYEFITTIATITNNIFANSADQIQLDVSDQYSYYIEEENKSEISVSDNIATCIIEQDSLLDNLLKKVDQTIIKKDGETNQDLNKRRDEKVLSILQDSNITTISKLKIDKIKELREKINNVNLQQPSGLTNIEKAQLIIDLTNSQRQQINTIKNKFTLSNKSVNINGEESSVDGTAPEILYDGVSVATLCRDTEGNYIDGEHGNLIASGLFGTLELPAGALRKTELEWHRNSILQNWFKNFRSSGSWWYWWLPNSFGSADTRTGTASRVYWQAPCRYTAVGWNGNNGNSGAITKDTYKNNYYYILDHYEPINNKINESFYSFANYFKDGSDITEFIDPNNGGNTEIQGEIFIEPGKEYTYRVDNSLEGSWYINYSYPLQVIIDNKAIKIKWKPSYGGDFTIGYRVSSEEYYQKKIVVKSSYMPISYTAPETWPTNTTKVFKAVYVLDQNNKFNENQAYFMLSMPTGTSSGFCKQIGCNWRNVLNKLNNQKILLEQKDEAIIKEREGYTRNFQQEALINVQNCIDWFMTQFYLEINRVEKVQEIEKNILDNWYNNLKDILIYWNNNFNGTYQILEEYTVENANILLQYINEIKDKIIFTYDSAINTSETLLNKELTILNNIYNINNKNLIILNKVCQINTRPELYNSKSCLWHQKVNKIILNTPYYYTKRLANNNELVSLGDSILEDFSLKTKEDEDGRVLYFLSPAKVYAEEDCAVIIKKNGTIWWEQPILIQKNYWPSALVNSWDGKVKIDEDNNAILAAMMVAGEKDNNNKFSGVMLGSIQGDKENSLSQNGIYGFSKGEQSYAFKEDGTAFIGTSGAGRIFFDGNQGTIQSANFELNSIENNAIQGLQIDLKNGILRAEGAQLNNGVVSGKFIATELQVGGQNFIKKVEGLDEEINLLKENLKANSATLSNIGKMLGVNTGYNITNYLTEVGDSVFFQFGKVFGSGNTTIEISKDGLLTATNAIISGTIYATNGVFTGTIYAKNGYIGDLSLSNGKLYAVKEFYLDDIVEENLSSYEDKVSQLVELTVGSTQYNTIRDEANECANILINMYRDDLNGKWTTNTETGLIEIDQSGIDLLKKLTISAYAFGGIQPAASIINLYRSDLFLFGGIHTISTDGLTTAQNLGTAISNRSLLNKNDKRLLFYVTHDGELKAVTLRAMNLNITNNTILSGDINIQKDTDITLGSNTEIYGTSNFKGNINIDSGNTLTVNGTSIFKNEINIDGRSFPANNGLQIHIDGKSNAKASINLSNTDINGIMNFTGASTFNNTLTINGTSTFNDDVTISNGNDFVINENKLQINIDYNQFKISQNSSKSIINIGNQVETIFTDTVHLPGSGKTYIGASDTLQEYVDSCIENKRQSIVTEATNAATTATESSAAAAASSASSASSAAATAAATAIQNEKEEGGTLWIHAKAIKSLMIKVQDIIQNTTTVDTATGKRIVLPNYTTGYWKDITYYTAD